MAKIYTATGPVDSADLGRTLMHEHVFTLLSELRAEYPWDEEAVVADEVKKLKKVRDLGIKTIVDLTVFGLGRFVPRVQRVAKESGVQIIVATGIYTFSDMPTFFRTGYNLNPTFISDFFVREIEEGIGNTGIRASILKCATGRHGFTEDIVTVIRQTAKAHRRTGVPISTHEDAETQQGLEQQKILREEGVDLSRVIIGHVDNVTDLNYIEALMKNGSYVGFDRFGYEVLCTAKDRLKALAELCKRGYARQIVLGHDYSGTSDNLSGEARRKNPLLAKWSYNYIMEEAVPDLLAAGVSQDDIDLMLIHNPRRIFEQTGGY